MYSERELDACLDSLSSQTYGNLDVVVIDDGSGAIGEKCTRDEVLILINGSSSRVQP